MARKSTGKSTAKAASSRPPGILLRMRRKNTPTGITRTTLRELARRLNLTETDTIHMALADRARSVGLLPRREPTLVTGPADLAGLDLSELKRVLELGMRAAAEDESRAAKPPRAAKARTSRAASLAA
jgi:hypothetical protein